MDSSNLKAQFSHFKYFVVNFAKLNCDYFKIWKSVDKFIMDLSQLIRWEWNLMEQDLRNGVKYNCEA